MIQVFFLLVMTMSGQQYVVDHGLTAEDCDKMKAKFESYDTVGATYKCEAQS